jgi:hypothetical protein
MRRGRSTLVLLVLLIALGVYVFFVDRTRPPSSTGPTDPKALAIPAENIELITIAAEDGDVTTIALSGTKDSAEWTITSPVADAVDAAAVSGITRTVATLPIRRQVDEHPTDLKQYGLDPPRVEVRVRTHDGQESRLLLGDRTPAGQELYAKLGSDARVFLVPTAVDADVNKNTWALRDKTVLKFDRAAVDSVEITAPRRTIRLTRHDLEWQMSQPLAVPADPGVVADLIALLATEQMQFAVNADAASLARFGLNPPVYTVVIGARTSRATLQVGNAADGVTAYARDVSRPLVFTIRQNLVDAVRREPAEFRRKDLFAFQTQDATRLEMSRRGRTFVYEKGGLGEGGARQWRELLPATRVVDSLKMEEALRKLSLLRAVSFVNAATIEAGGGDTTTSAVVTSRDSSNDRVRTERVTFTNAGTGAAATRADWPDAAKLDANAYRLLVAALDDLSR